MNYLRRAMSTVLTVTLSLVMSTAVLANTTTSSIRGSVATQAGQTFSNAAVTITHTPSGTVSRTTTNSSGAFSARSLRVGGPYSISVSGPGFENAKVDDVYLSLDQGMSVPVVVRASGAMEVVAVTAQRLGQTGFKNEGLSTSLGLEAL